MWNRDSPVNIVSLHWWPWRDWSSWPRLRRASSQKQSLGPRADNVIIPLDLTELSCPGFMLSAGLPSGFTTTESAAGGEPCGEPAISLRSHHVSLVQWTTCLLPVTRDPGSNPLGGLMWNRDSPVSVVSLQYNHFEDQQIKKKFSIDDFSPSFNWPAGQETTSLISWKRVQSFSRLAGRETTFSWSDPPIFLWVTYSHDQYLLLPGSKETIFRTIC
jgi:hypothetical protein